MARQIWMSSVWDHIRPTPTLALFAATALNSGLLEAVLVGVQWQLQLANVMWPWAQIPEAQSGFQRLILGSWDLNHHTAWYPDGA